MFFIDLLIAIIIALIFAGLLSASSPNRRVRRAGAWPIFLVWFVLLLLATWAGGVWLVPFGPLLWGAYWLPFVVVGLVVWFILAALAFEPPRRTLASTADRNGDTDIAIGLTIFFWLVLLALIAAIASHYWWR